MVRTVRKIKFWAVSVTVAVHLVVLIVFALIKPSLSEVQALSHAPPKARISDPLDFVDHPATMPKPKVKSAGQNVSIIKSYTDTLSDDQLFSAVDQVSENLEQGGKTSVPETDYSISKASSVQSTTEFFGSKTQARKICYVVDSSGSMLGMFKKVRQNLRTSIEKLQADQYFSIIFFGDGKIFELEKGKMLRASDSNKSKAFGFIDAARAKGQTNAYSALQRAAQIKDSHASRPEVIFFLTDGFELTGENSYRETYKINNLIKQIAFTTKVNTIGFWTSESDAEILKKIATTSGGRFININD